MNLRDRQILHIALPSIVSNITVPLLGLVDVAITGHLGDAAYIGAIAVGGMLFNIIYWMFAFLRMGTSGVTAQALGARNLTGVAAVMQRALLVAIIISAVMLCLQVPIREGALYIIRPSAEVVAFTCTYYNICIWGAPAALMLFVLTGWFVGMQNSRAPMMVAMIQNVANIMLSVVLVYGLGMKIEGVALGTVLAQYIGLVSALLFFVPYYLRINKYYREKTVLTAAALTKFFSLNKDIFLRTCCLILVHFFFIAAGAKQGDAELAVNTMLMQLFTLYSYIMDGFAFAGEAMVGKAIGGRMRGIYDDTVRRLFRWGWGVAALFTLAYLLLGQPFLCEGAGCRPSLAALDTPLPPVRHGSLHLGRHLYWRYCHQRNAHLNGFGHGDVFPALFHFGACLGQPRFVDCFCDLSCHERNHPDHHAEENMEGVNSRF